MPFNEGCHKYTYVHRLLVRRYVRQHTHVEYQGRNSFTHTDTQDTQDTQTDIIFFLSETHKKHVMFNTGFSGVLCH